MSWEKVTNHKVRGLPIGVARITGKNSPKAVYIGSQTVAAWDLGKTRSATVYKDASKKMLGLQFHEDESGEFAVVHPDGRGKGIVISPAQALSEVGAVAKSHVSVRKDKGLVTVDCSQVLAARQLEQIRLNR